MTARDLKIGQHVYHRDIYEHGERMEITGLTNEKVELKGDYSGGTNNSIEKQWMPIEGVSRVYKHKYKLECRKQAIIIDTLALPITDRKQDPMTETMFDLLHMVFKLTTDVELNPEF